MFILFVLFFPEKDPLDASIIADAWQAQHDKSDITNTQTEIIEPKESDSVVAKSPVTATGKGLLN